MIEVAAIDPEVGVIVEFSSVTDAAEATLLGAAACGDECALGFFGALGDDVDDAVDCVGAP